jgi:hypothetical protein
MEYELTDPAAEIADVITVLREQPASNDATYSVFQKAIGQNINSADYWHLISTLRYRVQRVERFISSVDEGEFRHQNQRKRLLQAVTNFSRAFEPSQQAAQWQAVLSRDVVADDGLQLAQFSYVARRLWPLRRLAEADRKGIIEKIETVLGDLNKNDDVPDWAKVPLLDGLVRLQLTLRHLIFFGYEAAIEELQNLYQKTISVEDIIATGKSEDGKRPKSILQVLNLVALAGALFALPDQTITAFERYQGLYLRAVMNSPRLPKPEQRYLPKPAIIEPEEPREQKEEKSPEPQ